MSRLHMAANWIPGWNNTGEEAPGEVPGPNSTGNTPKLDPPVTKDPTTLEPPIRSRAASTLPKRRKSSLEANKRASTTSLASMSGNWLSWAPMNRAAKRGNLAADEGEEGDSNNRGKSENDDESRERKNDRENGTGADNDAQTENDNDIDDYTAEDNNDEIDDHVTHGRKRLWGFWSGLATDRRDLPDKPTTFTNTILRSTPLREESGKNGSELVNGAQDTNSASDAPNGLGNAEPDDDAVLYKPHDSASQFSRINTHKNENLRENAIVPEWSMCLPHQRQENVLVTSQEVNQSFDIKNWRNYLLHLLARFGFGSPSSEPGALPETTVEKELHSLYERSYRLYGRSLAKLPPQKRACLPSYGVCYKNGKKQKTQLEEDAQDGNAVSITNDAMGNLLINPPPRSSPSIVSQKSGPLVKIRHVLIIGVHGFFPTRMIRPIIGAPKGTSLKFANEAEKAVIRYCSENGLMDDKNHLSIQKIALEKEGKIFDRVTFFLEIMTKWARELNEADFIFIASHSQGCVVSMMLFARLIESGVLKNPLQKRIGLLGMAGVNNGPFYGIDKSLFMKAYSAIEHDLLMELFELTKFDSPQSVAYKKAVATLVSSNVKICFIGSINDQLVPLYSALGAHIYHPNIYRACYIDHSSRTPDFIKRLVSVCCHLQNLGYFDNNVIKELSAVLAGPLTGGGHLKIYNDGKVYDLGLKFALDTDDLVIPNADVGMDVDIPEVNQVYVKEYSIGKIGTNPYVLPWCLRGLLFNIEKNWPEVPPHITQGTWFQSGAEVIDGLYELFDRWKPDTKPLKDLKFRLNGIRSSKL